MSGQRVIGRYAPSPTGPLHLGNLRTALLAWLQVRVSGGVFILRVEDLDAPRVRKQFYGLIAEQLWALGLDWDIGPKAASIKAHTSDFTQSQRLVDYAGAMRKLRDQGWVYPCYCSRKDIQQAASAPHGSGPRIYPGTCRPPVDGVRNSPTPSPARAPAWRFRVPPDVLRFDDQLLGNVDQDLATECGDFVVQRADGVYAYQLACAVDDGMMKITDVVRGGDLLESTPRQIVLLRALGFSVPRYWHVPLMRGEDGKRMAKRDQTTAPELADKTQAAVVVGDLAYGVGLIARPMSISAADLLGMLTPTTFAERLKAKSRR